jgi:hypothetical protein
LLPPLLLRLDRGAGAVKTVPTGAPGSGPLARALAGHSRLVLGASLILIAGGRAPLPWLDGTRIEYDMRKLRNRESLVRGEGYWSREMDAVLGRNFTAVVFMTESEYAAQRVAAALADAVRAEPLRRVASRVVTPADLLPPDEGRPARRARPHPPPVHPGGAGRRSATGIRDRLEALLAAAEVPAHRRRAARAAGAGPAREGRPLRPRRAHAAEPRRFDLGRRRHHPRAAALERVASVVLAARRGGRRVRGLRQHLETLSREALPTTAAAFGAVVLVVLALFRFRRDAWLVLAALLAGGHAAGGRGGGARPAHQLPQLHRLPHHLRHRRRVRAQRAEPPPPAARRRRRLGGRHRGAVALCSLTTIIGYGSLLLARNQAILSFGLLAVLGEICCLFVAVVALPAALASTARARGP